MSFLRGSRRRIYKFPRRITSADRREEKQTEKKINKIKSKSGKVPNEFHGTPQGANFQFAPLRGGVLKMGVLHARAKSPKPRG
jgi:hypothetical protein